MGENQKRAKIGELRTLAEQFREKCRATAMADYIALMAQTAQELDEFADVLEREASTPHGNAVECAA